MTSKYKDIIMFNVKLYCKKSRMRIVELEKEVGVSAGYFSRLKDFPLSMLEKLEEITGMSIAELCKKPILCTLRVEIKPLSEMEADNMYRKILEICMKSGNRCLRSYEPYDPEEEEAE